MKVYFAADHAGFELKNHLLNAVRGLGFDVEDCGAFRLEPLDDYPLYIGDASRKLSEDVRRGIESRAIVLGASGQGEAMAANRFRGVRCALYYGGALDVVVASRAHNNANALSLGARYLDASEAEEAVRRWLDEPFSKEERHIRRNDRLDTLG